METHDVVVIGAGAMGSAASRALAAAGRQVVTLEKYELGHDRGGSHGGTRLFRLAVDDEDYLLGAWRAGQLWAELEDESGQRLLEPTGGLDHGVDEETSSRSSRAISPTSSRVRDLPLTPTDWRPTPFGSDRRGGCRPRRRIRRRMT